MFSVEHYVDGRLQIRREHLTGIRCRISPERIRRNISSEYHPPATDETCPFCPGRIERETPTFPDGTRIRCGKSLTFPNLYPFAPCHTVTVITPEHSTTTFTAGEIRDALTGQVRSLIPAGGYPSINWNLLPSAGASMVHPHLQGIAGPEPTWLTGRYIDGSRRYLSQSGRTFRDDHVDAEAASDRLLFEDGAILWAASPVPIGEYEVRGYLPAASLEGAVPHIPALSRGIVRVTEFYHALGVYAFNMAIHFDRQGDENGFGAFCSIIARMNPNPESRNDSAFMERLHLEPVVLTLPEDLGRAFRDHTV
ncbi:galactose-1-phosphate uridylyltransferase [Methanofollis fontis]|uniref:Galactose-1-phosphate uridylyltransferase n=1 Tax=Methanofollis fontis TaxID=2052832 RepID=A0A483CSF6_9EURY|nr:galactose-1-phosphate uridylyltransferase [Methanofollis fontis]TAJ45274.1 galactose-1-phosphate uridylyltransferase [Methanofollis fontis]